MGLFDWLKATKPITLDDLGLTKEQVGRIDTDDGSVYVVPTLGDIVGDPSRPIGIVTESDSNSARVQLGGTWGGSSTTDYTGMLHSQQQQNTTANKVEVERGSIMQQTMNNGTWGWTSTTTGSTLDWRLTLMDSITQEARDLLAAQLPRKGFHPNWSITHDPNHRVWSLVVWYDGSRPTSSGFGAVTVPLITEELAYEMATMNPRLLQDRIWQVVQERIEGWIGDQPDVLVTWEEPLYDLDGPVEKVVL